MSQDTSSPFLLPVALLVCAAGLSGIGLTIASVAKNIAHPHAAHIHLASPEERVREPGMASRGESVFEAQLCAGCHGKQLEGGAGPCLTDAAWLKGSGATDIIKSINEGSAEKGMPPFADKLSEDEKLALVAFIRSRAQGLRDVKYRLYEGAWKQLPDFASLKPVEEGGLKDDEPIALAKFERTANYGVVYTGQLLAPAAGGYEFQLASDDGSEFLIDGRRVVINDGLHADSVRKTGQMELKAGAHAFELRYFQAAANQGLKLTWAGPVSAGFLTEPVLPLDEAVVTQRARIVRGNLRGMNTGYVLSMGFPGGVNCAFDAGRGAFAFAWRGDFLNVAGPHAGRTQAAAPLAEKTLPLTAKPAVLLADRPEVMPELLGYRLAGGQVVLHMALDGAKFDMTVEAVPSGLRATVLFVDPVPGMLKFQDSTGTRTVTPAQAGPQILQFTF